MALLKGIAEDEMVWIMLGAHVNICFTLATRMRSDRLELVLTINENAGHAINEHLLFDINDYALLLCPTRLCYHLEVKTRKVCSKTLIFNLLVLLTGFEKVNHQLITSTEIRPQHLNQHNSSSSPTLPASILPDPPPHQQLPP
jgi:hypothetical protein